MQDDRAQEAPVLRSDADGVANPAPAPPHRRVPGAGDGSMTAHLDSQP